MAIHNVSKRDWPTLTWKFPLIHNFEFRFGLSAESPTKAATIVPYFFQDNALVDYENVKTNPENADFATVGYPNVMAGSYVPKVLISWNAAMYAVVEAAMDKLKWGHMRIGTSMLNRLDAFDKKTGDDIEAILELQHETTDEQAGPLYNGTKLFEGAGASDLDFTKVPFLTTDGQLEGVDWDKEKFFDALHYYTNKEMLKLVTDKYRSETVYALDIPHGRDEINFTQTINTPSLCKFQHPYTYCGELFNVPQVGARDQFHTAGQAGAVEHLVVKGFVRFYEFNPDFNFARA